MKVGKLSESILKRSVLKQIKTINKNVLSGAGVGADCAIFAQKDAGRMVACVQDGAVAAKADMVYLIHRTANNLACSGAVAIAAMITVIIPESAEEAELKSLMQAAEETCAFLGIQIAGGHSRVSAHVSGFHVTVTGIGEAGASPPISREAGTSPPDPGKAAKCVIFPGKSRPGQEIVISKWIALEGSARIAEASGQELLSRYPRHMIEEVCGFGRYISIIKEADCAVRTGVTAMHDISEGGVFRALWELAESAGVGLEVELKKLPVRQETIEVCEFFNVNPYELLSGGSLIMVTDHATELVRELKKEGIPAAVVGKITDNNDRVIINEEERRFLDRPRTDEIYKVLK